ncbi:MAG: potassium-transporting ATPase subunit KdpA, partial [Tahibacter sp.]
MAEVFLILIAAVLLAWPLGRYLSQVLKAESSPLDRVFTPIENGIYRLLRINALQGMTWRGYAMAFLLSNA